MKRLFALVFLVFLAACSGDNGTEPTNQNNGGGGGGGGGGGSATSADTLHVLTMQDVIDHLEQWGSLDQDTIATRALKYISSLPVIEDAGITPGTTTVWANFKDGFSFLIPNNREPSTMADTLVDALHSPGSQRVTPSRAPVRHITIPAGRRMLRALRVPERGRELPAVPRFRAVNAIGTCHINPLPGIRALLTAGHYTNAYPGPPTVANLKNVKGDGIFYINSHGGPGFDKNKVAYYAVWTIDPIDLATLANYSSMVNSHEVVGMLEYSNDATGNCACVMHYGITSTFVRNHMSFAKNSLVIIDACSSASAPAQSMRDAFTAVGASVYVGWTKSVNAGFAYASMKYLLDRILGLNVISPEDPEQRAFNIYDVKDDMATNRSLAVQPDNGSELTVFQLGEDFGLLTPSIQFLSLDDSGQQPTLMIAGLFGTDPGEANRSVTINGQPLDNIQWSPTEIDCDIDESGPNANGEVVVKVGSGANARESNHVNITEWKGELTYSRDDPGDQKEEMKVKVRFLADIHDFRDKPGEQPFKTTVLFTTRAETSVHATSSGSYSHAIGKCTEKWTFGQGGDLPTPFEGSSDGSWIYFGSVDTQAHTLRLVMSILCVFKAGTWVMTGPVDECQNFNRPFYVTLSIEDCLFDDRNQATAFQIPMDDKFVVQDGERGPCTVQPLVGELSDGSQAQAQIKWDVMTPVSLPDADAAR